MEATVRSPRAVVRFAHFELDLQTHELFKRGHRVKLQDQPFQVLAMLLERPGEMVTREELHHRLWPGETVASMDDGLNAAIRRLRFTLSDSAGRSKYIETLPRRGYRFIAPVERVHVDEPEIESPPMEAAVVTGRFGVAPAAIETGRGLLRRPLLFGGLATIAILVLGFLLRFGEPEPAAPDTPRPRTSFLHLTKAAGIEGHPTVSPDGRFVAYVASERGNEDIYVQRVGSEEALNLTPSSNANDRQPAFSPDGQLIAFRSERDGGGIFVMDAGGGALRRVSDFGFDPAWSPDGEHLVVATEGVVNPLSRTSVSSLWRIDLSTGLKTKIYDGDAVQPAWAPGGERIAFWRTTGNAGKRDIATIPAAGGPLVLVTDDAAIDWSPVWSPDGRWIYFASDRGGSMNLWRVAVDERAGAARGQPEAITTPARWSGDLAIGGGGATIAFTSSDPRSNIQRIAFDPERETVAGDPIAVTEATLSLIQPAVSPDGAWIVYRSEIEQEDLYISHPDGTGQRKLTNDPANDRGPSWSADGQRITFYSDRSGKYEAWSVRPDGSDLRQLTDTTGTAIFFPILFPDRSAIAVNTPTGSFIVRLSDGRPAERLEPLPAYPDEGRVFRSSSLSRDGRWLAGTLYSSAGVRVPGVVVYSLDERRYQVVTTFGSWPAWLSDGRRLLFGDGDSVHLADRVTGETRELIAIDGEIPFGISVSGDDRQIYFARAARESDIWLAQMR